MKFFCLLLGLNLIIVNGDQKVNVMPNGSPNMAGLWEESSGRLWKSSQMGNTFTWVQEKTNRVAKGIIVAKYPDSESDSSDWLVYITIDSKVNWPLQFSEDFSNLTAQNDVFKRVRKPAINNDPICPEATATIDTGVPILYGSLFKETSGNNWLVQSQSISGVLVFKSQTEKRFFRAFAVRNPQTKEYVIYIDGGKDLKRIETYDIRKWTLPNKELFTTTNQIIQLN